MARKLLTALDQVTARNVQVLEVITAQQMQTLLIRKQIEESATLPAIQRTIPFLNVQQLMATMKAIELLKQAAFLLPRQQQETLAKTLPTPYEFWEIQTKRLIPTSKLEAHAIERQQRLTREHVEAEMKLTRLHERSIIMLEQTILAEMEKLIFNIYKLKLFEALGTLLKASYNRSWVIERIVGLEHLQKLLAQLYYFVMMEYPLARNLMALRVTPVTMELLKHKVGSIYACVAMQKQELQQKALLKTAVKQKEDTKTVIKYRGSPLDIITTRENVGVTEDLTGETKISAGKDDMGKEWIFTTLRYAYSIPFWIRRMIVRNLGMPENHKYARYFGIGCIPSRYARYSFKRRSYDDISAFLYSKDERIMKSIIRRKYRDIIRRYPVPTGKRYLWNPRKVGKFEF